MLRDGLLFVWAIWDNFVVAHGRLMLCRDGLPLGLLVIAWPHRTRGMAVVAHGVALFFFSLLGSCLWHRKRCWVVGGWDQLGFFSRVYCCPVMRARHRHGHLCLMQGGGWLGCLVTLGLRGGLLGWGFSIQATSSMIISSVHGGVVSGFMQKRCLRVSWRGISFFNTIHTLQAFYREDSWELWKASVLQLARSLIKLFKNICPLLGCFCRVHCGFKAWNLHSSFHKWNREVEDMGINFPIDATRDCSVWEELIQEMD